MARSDDVRALGRYTLDEPIATGTTATIWRAHETKTGRQVAVKRFHAHLFADPIARKRMENEAKAARRVHGPTIVSAIDKISTRDEFALVFPFVSGTALSERLLAEPQLTAEECASIAADVADALAAIHKAGLVHRDVKPGNILLGDDGRARLLDFGISRAVTDEIEVAGSMTGAGLAIGTLPYMAPEQLAAEPITGATDVFALGVVLYELLAGRRPFSAVTPVALVAEQHVVPARIASAPAPLVDLALHALSVDPRGRRSAQQMSAALRGWLAVPLAADAPTALVRGAPAARVAMPSAARRGLVPVLAGAAAVVLIAVVALAAMQPAAIPAESPSNPPLAAAAPPAATASPRPTESAQPSATPVASAAPSATSVPAKPSAAPKAQPTGTSPKPHTGHPHHGHHHHHHKHHRRHHRH